MSFSSISDLWSKWNVRGFVILSLLLQVSLVLFAPLRKKIVNRYIIFLLWLAYLMADWVAAFAIGLISHNQGNSCTHTEVDGALQVFWASFLLLHLGGPDTITAYSMEDSSLWRRHLLSLIFQVSAAIYIFLQIFPSNNLMVIPTMLVFLAGVIKNAERLLALNLSSLSRLREWMISSLRRLRNAKLPNKSSRYRELLEELNDSGDGYSNEEEVKLAESIVVKHAYCFFQIFMFFLGDLVFRCPERELSHKYFNKVSAVDALRIISMELDFIYEVLHTKVLAIRSKRSYIFRFIGFTNIMTAFILFNRLKKHQLPKFDVEITYSLLFGGIALDVIGLFMLIFSDWTIAEIKWYNIGSSKLDLVLHKLVSATDNLRKPQFAKCEAEPNTTSKVFLSSYGVLDTPLIFRRWSESISACNLLSESLKESPRKIYKCDRRCGIVAFSSICSFPFRMAEKITSWFHQAGEAIATGCGSWFRIDGMIPRIANTKYLSTNPFIKELWVFIFAEVRRKSQNVHGSTDLKKIFEAKGNLFLKSRPEGIDCCNLLKYITHANYDASIIIWHLATEIWYNIENQFMSPTTRNEREFSKMLSDYMLYLLLNQPNLVYTVAGIAQITSADTVLKLREYINVETKDVGRLSKKMYEDDFDLISRRWTCPLREGIYLAQEMERLKEMKWRVMSGVWVEMLSYAAIHIRGEAHMQVLSNGGEFLAFVWLLMVHFGCIYKSEWGMNSEPLGQWSKRFDF